MSELIDLPDLPAGQAANAMTLAVVGTTPYKGPLAGAGLSAPATGSTISALASGAYVAVWSGGAQKWIAAADLFPAPAAAVLPLPGNKPVMFADGTYGACVRPAGWNGHADAHPYAYAFSDAKPHAHANTHAKPDALPDPYASGRRTRVLHCAGRERCGQLP